jgi:hypothetical protein
MNTTATPQYTIALSAEERNTLADILEEELKATAVEARRTQAFAAHEIIKAREAKVETLLRKVREAGCP